jgi:hypothetical protein
MISSVDTEKHEMQQRLINHGNLRLMATKTTVTACDGRFGTDLLAFPAAVVVRTGFAGAP